MKDTTPEAEQLQRDIIHAKTDYERTMMGIDMIESIRKIVMNSIKIDKWIDFDFWGHQVVAHMSPQDAGKSASNEVDGHAVPAKHFGVILEWDQFFELADRLKKHEMEFVIEPYVRFEGKPGEQATMFFLDPSGNALEFKAFRDESQIFAK